MINLNFFQYNFFLNTVDHTFTENGWTKNMAKQKRNQNDLFLLFLQTDGKPNALENNGLNILQRKG